MTHHDNQDESQTLCPACEIGPFIRNHYFTGKLMLERDFTDEQRYFIEKIRHHHQRLHGWGVVCGLKVKQHANPACRDRYICIEPGTAIDCCGHEIVVREEECIDITQLPSIKALNDKPHTLQVCLRYRESPTEEIPVLYDECGCDDTKCAPNRILESYDVDVIDVIIDPLTSKSSFHTPLLKWHCTVSPAHASRVALHSASHLMYVITADNAKTVFQLDTDNYTVVGAHALPEKGLELAVSNDGTRVYIVTEGAGGAGNDRQLVVLDTTNNMGNESISTSIIMQSANNDIFLSVAPAPDNRLFALLGAKGDVLLWSVGLDTASPALAPSATISLGSNLSGLVIGNKASEGYTIDTTNNAIQVLDIAGAKKGRTITPNTPQTPFSQPAEVALVSSTAPDMLAVVSESNKQLYLVGLNPDTLVGSVPLDHKPVALTVSPGGQWAYVLEQDTTVSFVQSVNLNRIQLKLSPVVGTPFNVGDASQQIVVSDSGAHLYIPFTDDLIKPAIGGVAVLDLSEQACAEILWRHLDGCPQCDMPNCVVLATIENYHVGDKIEDQTDPPANPATDIAAHINRIDNRKGRQLLPSTQVLLEMIECLKQQGPGGTGPQGPPGTPGKQGLTGDTGEKGDTVAGPAGPGLEEDLVRIKALSWKHNEPNTFFNVQMENDDERVGIVIEFTDLVDVGRIIDSNHVFQLLVEKVPAREGDQARLESIFRCRCPIVGDIVPVKCVDNGAGLITSANQVTNLVAPGVAFVLDERTREMIKGALLQELIRPDFSVILRGDFVLDIDGRAVDAEFVRAELPTGDRPKGSLYGIQGGTFESWFSVPIEG